jgi:hypothetical protein
LRGVFEIGEKQQKSPHQTKLKAVVTLHGIFLTSVILSLILDYSLANLLKNKNYT